MNWVPKRQNLHPALIEGYPGALEFVIGCIVIKYTFVPADLKNEIMTAVAGLAVNRAQFAGLR